MVEEKRRPWRRWVVLALMIAGFIIGGIYVPIQPEISVKAENLLGEGQTWLFGLPLVNTIPTLIATIILVLVIAWFTNRSLKRSEQTDMVPRGIGNLMEAFFEMLYNLTEGSAGVKWARAIFPWFATIMFYVLLANLLKLIPGFESIGVLHPAHGEGLAAQPIGSSALSSRGDQGHATKRNGSGADRERHTRHRNLLRIADRRDAVSSRLCRAFYRTCVAR